jgi:tetratricopeptide (TPR) repeat protein
LAAVIPAIALPAVALEDPATPDRSDEVCEEVEAYSLKLRKAERKQREEEARHGVFSTMAERVWADAFDERPATTAFPFEYDPSAQGLGVPASKSAFTTLRARYEINERIAGGRYYSTGTKHQKQVGYCLPSKAYRKIRDELREERSAVVNSLRTRFEGLETLIELGDMEAASLEHAALRVDVVTEAVELATYHSERRDRTRAFHVWLLEWSDVVPKGPELVRDLTARAAQLMEQGLLGEADRYVSEALEIDRSNEEARRLRIEIQERRNTQAELAWEAQDLAADGHYRAAESKLDEARAIGKDDAELLEDAANAIDGVHAADLAYNPQRRVLIFASFGAMGVDTDRIEQKVAEDAGLYVDASSPLSIGGGANFRVGRLFQVGFTGSFGFSEATNFRVGRNAQSLYDLLQFTASAGLATRRGPKRSFSYQVTGGVVWERVDGDSLFVDTLDDAASQTGLFVRFAAEREHLTLFIQHGFGFEDEPGSVVSWDNKTQFGIGGVF